jgi:nitrate/nitrite transport system permease protein
MSSTLHENSLHQNELLSLSSLNSVEGVLLREPALTKPQPRGETVVPAHLRTPPTGRTGVRGVLRSLASNAPWMLLGLGILVGGWALAASRISDLPSPAATATELGRLLSDPLRNAGPNDQGVLRQLAGSLMRVGQGFLVAAVVGVPLGLLIGASDKAWKAVNPVIQLLRPVSPLAWFPIWLVTIKDAPKAGVVVIFITALWPIAINTASAAGAIPTDQRHVARVFKFNKLTYLRHVLLPNALPGIVTGMRLSMGVAWMVIVAVEMLSGGTGIGFFVWDAYNALNLARVVAAILLIGVTGLLLDALFLRLGRKAALPGSLA